MRLTRAVCGPLAKLDVGDAELPLWVVSRRSSWRSTCGLVNLDSAVALRFGGEEFRHPSYFLALAHVGGPRQSGGRPIHRSRKEQAGSDSPQCCGRRCGLRIDSYSSSVRSMSEVCSANPSYFTPGRLASVRSIQITGAPFARAATAAAS